MYDNTKFEAAFAAWLEANVEVGYGEHYAGDLLDDFDRFLAETKMLKRNPGRVVFGRQLSTLDLEKRKRYGLTYWSGLTLKTPPKKDALAPKRYARTQEAQERRFREIEAKRKEIEFDNSPEAEQARLAAFKAELKTETKENIQKVGEE
jgi:hypothetical protein